MVIRFYTSKVCPWAQRVHIALIECLTNEHFNSLDIIEIDLTNKPAWYVNVHPQQKVPALQLDSDTILLESLPITEYILDQYGAHTNLIPKTTMGRYEMRLFIETFQNGILQPFYQLLRAKSLEEQEKMKVCLLEGIKRISARIKGPYALGSEFTLADIATVPWPLRFDVIEHFRGFVIPDTPEFLNFKQWVANCCNRESIQRSASQSSINLTGYAKYIRDGYAQPQPYRNVNNN